MKIYYFYILFYKNRIIDSNIHFFDASSIKAARSSGLIPFNNSSKSAFLSSCLGSLSR